MRALATILLLLLPTLARGQGLTSKIDRALDPMTDPKQRVALLAEIVAESGGPAALAKRGLDPRGDSEVVHAVVGALLAAGDPGPALEPVMRLLAYDAHRAKVGARLQRMAENLAVARRVLVPLEAWALGKGEDSKADAALRLAAVRAIALLPLREAVEILVEAWGRDQEAKVLEECRASLADVVIASTPDQARTFLRERPYASYYDLVKEVTRRRQRDLEGITKYVDIAFRHATAKEALDALSDSNTLIQQRSMERLFQLADTLEGKEDPMAHLGMPPGEFAKAVFDAFVREQKNGATPKVIALLCDTLARLARGGDLAPLRPEVVPVADLVEAVGRLAASPADWEEAGKACVRLLDEIGEPGVRILARFAGDPGSPEVRMRAITALRSRALRPESAAIRDFIGRQLAERVEREKDAAVRSRILFALRDTPVAQAVEPIRRLLGADPQVAATALSEVEYGYCVEILWPIRTPEALATLIALTESKSATPRMRLVAATDGLLRRLSGGDEDAAILERLRAMALSPEQAMETRTGLLERMGEAGPALCHKLLGDLARNESLEAPLRPAAATARLRIAERLATPAGGAAAAAGDLETAGLILAEEWKAGADVARVESLAREVLKTGDAAKLPAGPARFLVARLADREGADIQEMRKLYRAAMERALDDRLGAEYERELLLRYRAILKQVELSPETMERYIIASLRLAVLSGDSREKAIGFWIDAIERAVDAKDRDRVEKLVAEMPREGALPPAAATRLEQVRARLEAPSSDGK